MHKLGQSFGVIELRCDHGDLLLTPSVSRILQCVADSCRSEDLGECAAQLICALLDEESLAGSLLRSAGVTAANVGSHFPAQAKELSSATDIGSTGDVSAAEMIQHLPIAVARIVAEAQRIARLDLRSEGISSEHLLAAILQFNTPVCRNLHQQGVTAELMLANCTRSEMAAKPITVPFTPRSAEEVSNVEQLRLLSQIPSIPTRVLDACMNRAREGIRVLEDCARFVMDDGVLVRELKDLRHRLAASEQKLATVGANRDQSHSIVAERDVSGDFGTELTGSVERVRHGTMDIVHANSKRVQESLRSLEEFGKLVSPEFSVEMKQLRYRAYEIHQRMLMSAVRNDLRRQRLRQATVCVLVTEEGCRHAWKQVVESCLQGGADMIQLREKHLDDQELLLRAEWLAQICHEANALCIVNDRSDVAHLSGADGVHLGQHDCQVKDVRRLISPDLLIGLSTHNAADVESADARAADYLGVGPVFPSITKEFDSIAGLELLDAAKCVTTPWFAIGGIDQNRVERVVEAGARRIAVSSAVIGAEEPGRIVRNLRKWFNGV
jgi:thiamine-phosphate pyrophosphorylase